MPDSWRTAMWDATLACWLWTVAVSEREIALPPFGEQRIAFDDDDVPDSWRTAMWDATLACWLWTVAVSEREIALPPFGEQRIVFDDDDVPVLVGARPRFDSTLWGLQQMLDDAA